MVRALLCSVLLGFAALPAYAQVQISAEARPPKVSVGSAFQLVLTVNGAMGNVGSPVIPSVNGLSQYSTSQSQNLSIINGQVSAITTLSITYLAEKEGKFSIGPMELSVEGQTHSISAVEVEVVRGAVAPQASASPQSRGGSATAPSEQGTNASGEGALFVRSYTDKLRAYVGEQITLTFGLYIGTRLGGRPGYEYPSTSGFWVEELLPAQRQNVEVMEGRQYTVVSMPKALFPTASGKYEIGAGTLEADVLMPRAQNRRSRWDIFDDDFFGMFSRTQRVARTSEPITVEILPLPKEGRPATFSGDVGQLNFRIRADKGQVKQHEPVTIYIEVFGKGNIKSLAGPKLPEIPKTRQLQGGTSEDVDSPDDIIQGTKVFETVLVPLESGTLLIPSLEYSYFDPAAEAYRSTRSQPLEIQVLPGEKGSAAAPEPSAPEVHHAPVKLIEKDIRHIHLSKGLEDQGTRALGPELLIRLVLILLWLAALGWGVHLRRLENDPRYGRQLGAGKAGRDRLRQAEELLAKGQNEEAATAMAQALSRFVADRVNLPKGALTLAELDAALKERQVGIQLREELRRILQACEQIRFVPGGSSSENVKSLLSRAGELIKELGRKV
ncbi:MAG: protein BatD [Candidatus Omnitrophica bacterium]|nr:protein BatD [Candidatus Omnitrophota bacterium]